LHKTFGRGETGFVPALRDFSMDVAPGEFVAVVGPSGCGKSTLLRLVAGLIEPSSGSIAAGSTGDGRPRFGMVFQNPVLLPWRTALDNVLLPIELLGWSTKGYTERAADLLDTVGLEGFGERRPAELSGGMRQRVSLCRALVHDPSILLMDEPFSSIDEITRESLQDLLLDVWQGSRKTIVFVTHNVTEAVYLSDRVVVLSERPGRIKETVPVLLPRPRDAELRYSADFVDRVRAVQEALRS
jgi:NitT/TauT family transport system ATP-binding protein